jgi:hypothetical protein
MAKLSLSPHFTFGIVLTAARPVYQNAIGQTLAANKYETQKSKELLC